MGGSTGQGFSLDALLTGENPLAPVTPDEIKSEAILYTLSPFEQTYIFDERALALFSEFSSSQSKPDR